MTIDNVIEIENGDYIVEIELREYAIYLENMIVTDYAYCADKPSIGGEELVGDKSPEELGLTPLSSKVTSLVQEVTDEQYPSAKCVKDELNLKADTSLNNLTAEGEKHFLNKSQITNCILEAPHMVDLELVDGTLTLKAGSKVIVPYGTSAPTMSIGDSLNGGAIVDISWDGSKLFYIVEYEEDETNSTTGVLNNAIVFVSDGSLGVANSGYSGTSTTYNGNYTTYYNTATNIIRAYYVGSSAYKDYVSLPFALCDRTTSGFTSITQTFQHIGYIGSTVWAMKGIKGLIPNGRNEDGSFKNIEYISPAISTRSYSTGNPQVVALTSGNAQTISRYGFEVNDEGFLIDLDTGLLKPNCFTIVAFEENAGINSSSWRSKNPFQALDQNDTEFITRQAMPSSKYISLTLGASGTDIYPPADGYICLSIRAANANYGYVLITNYAAGSVGMMSSITNGTNAEIKSFCPVKKGDQVRYWYGGAATAEKLSSFTFVYTVGFAPN